MTSIQHDYRQAIREKLRQRDASAVDQEFMINLFDSVVEIIDVDENFTSEDMIRIREEISAKLLSNQHLLKVLRQQAAELDTLRRLSLHFSSSLNLTTILNTLVSDVVELIEEPRTAHIFLYLEEKDLIQFGAARDEEGPKEKSYAEPRKNGLTYQVARTGKQIIVPDMSNHPIYEDAPKDWCGSILGIPLKVEDSVVGVMNISRSITGDFSQHDLRLLELLAEQAAIAISNARIHAKVSKQAKSDTLTGLPNRRALDERLEQEIIAAYRTGHPFATVMMDLDGFKVVNDTYGHPVGDLVLNAVFNYLALGLRSSDFLARYGGDELTLVLPQSDMLSTKLVTDKLMEQLQKFSFTLPDGSKLKISMSGGIALHPIHGQTASQLLRAADAALYNAKKHQRGSFSIATRPTEEIAE